MLSNDHENITYQTKHAHVFAVLTLIILDIWKNNVKFVTIVLTIRRTINFLSAQLII